MRGMEFDNVVCAVDCSWDGFNAVNLEVAISRCRGTLVLLVNTVNGKNLPSKIGWISYLFQLDFTPIKVSTRVWKMYQFSGKLYANFRKKTQNN